MGLKNKGFDIIWADFPSGKQDEINKAFKGITISIDFSAAMKPLQVEKPAIVWSESDPKVRAIKACILQNSDIYYTEDINEFRRLGGMMAHFCQAFYSNPLKLQQHGSAMFAPSIMSQYEVVAVMNVDNQMFTPNAGQPISGARRLSLWFHEFGHATGHSTRLNRPVINDVQAHHDRRQAAIEELIAEKCARIGMNHFGMAVAETNAFHETYLKMQFTQIPVEEHEFINAQTDRDAEAAFQYILNNWLVGLDLSQEEAA